MTEQSSNSSLWIPPTFEVISLSMECTAYAATLAVEDQDEHTSPVCYA